MVIGVATTIAKEEGYDALTACRLAQASGFLLLQMYFKEDYLNKDYLNKLVNNKIILIGHSGSKINEGINNSELEFFDKVLKDERIIVFHHNVGTNAEKNIEKVEKYGLVVGLENTYDSEECRISFLELIKQNKNIIPVLDLKRYLRRNALKEFYDDLNYVKSRAKFIIHFEDMENYPVKEVMKVIMEINPPIVVIENDGVMGWRKALGLISNS